MTNITFLPQQRALAVSYRCLIAALLISPSFIDGICLAQAGKQVLLPDDVLRIVNEAVEKISGNDKSLNEALKEITANANEASQAEFERLMKAGQIDIAGAVRDQQQEFRRVALDPDFFNSRRAECEKLPQPARGIFIKALKDSDTRWRKTHELNEKVLEDGRRALKSELERLTRSLLVNESFATRELYEAFRETVIRQVYTGQTANERPLPTPRNKKFAGKWDGFDAWLVCDQAGGCTMTWKPSGRFIMEGKLAPWVGGDFADKDFYHYRAEVRGSNGVSYRLQPNGDDELMVVAVSRDGKTIPIPHFRRSR